MAANDQGLVIGNEAVWTTEPDDTPAALLGMDLVRLAAERCHTSESAVDCIADLLHCFGQGGGCEEGGTWSYHNAFLIADRKEAWVMETAGKWWVAEKVNSGVRNISNCLSIRDKVEKRHPLLFQYCFDLDSDAHDAKSEEERTLDWAKTFSSGGAPPLGRKSAGREAAGYELLNSLAGGSSSNSKSKNCNDEDGVKSGEITAELMMHKILRNKESGICMCGGGFTSTGSQVSLIQSSLDTVLPDIHWFTATPDPSRSAFKPFVFPRAKSDEANTQPLVHQPSDFTVAAKNMDNKRVHILWQQAAKAWRKASNNKQLKSALLRGLTDVEEDGIRTVYDVLQGRQDEAVLYTLFDDLCQKELALYNSTLQQ